MWVKMTKAWVTARFLRPCLRVAGIVTGLCAGFFVLALLTAGSANAAESTDEDDGLFGSLTGSLVETLDQVVPGEDSSLGAVVEPVLHPVTRTVDTVTTSVLQPVVSKLEPVLSKPPDVDKPDTARPAPKTRHDEPEPVVKTVPVVEQPNLSAVAVSSAKPVPVRQRVQATTAVSPVRAELARTTARSTGWVPDLPVSPEGPALTGSPGSSAVAPHGTGVDGSAFTGVTVLPHPGGDGHAASGALVGPAWWTSFGRHHPS